MSSLVGNPGVGVGAGVGVLTEGIAEGDVDKIVEGAGIILLGEEDVPDFGPGGPGSASGIEEDLDFGPGPDDQLGDLQELEDLDVGPGPGQGPNSQASQEAAEGGASPVAVGLMVLGILLLVVVLR